MRKLVLFSLLSVLLIACKKDNADDFELKIFFVAAQKGSYTTWTGAAVPSIMVKENPTDSYWALGQDIEGFDYVEGFEYKIDVKEYILKNPPQDASNRRYVLNRIISKQ